MSQPNQPDIDHDRKRKRQKVEEGAGSPTGGASDLMRGVSLDHNEDGHFPRSVVDPPVESDRSGAIRNNVPPGVQEFNVDQMRNILPIAQCHEGSQVAPNDDQQRSVDAVAAQGLTATGGGGVSTFEGRDMYMVGLYEQKSNDYNAVFQGYRDLLAENAMLAHRLSESGDKHAEMAKNEAQRAIEEVIKEKNEAVGRENDAQRKTREAEKREREADERAEAAKKRAQEAERKTEDAEKRMDDAEKKRDRAVEQNDAKKKQYTAAMEHARQRFKDVSSAHSQQLNARDAEIAHLRSQITDLRNIQADLQPRSLGFGDSSVLGQRSLPQNQESLYGYSNEPTRLAPPTPHPSVPTSSSRTGRAQDGIVRDGSAPGNGRHDAPARSPSGGSMQLNNTDGKTRTGRK